MTDQALRELSALEMQFIERVHNEVGEIPASATELVLRKGPAAKRFQGITLVQLRRITIIADEMDIGLPTFEI